MKMFMILLLITLSTQSFAEVNMAQLSELPNEVQSFLKAVKEQDSKLFESVLAEDILVDDWGKMIKGKKETLAFSASHLIGAKANFEISEIKNDENGTLLDGLWKSEAFTGPTRFIFQIKNQKIQKMIISSPRWFDRAFIKVKSIF